MRPNGRPKFRNARELASDTERVIEVIRFFGGPLAAAELRQRTGMSGCELRKPLRRAREAGRILRKRAQGTWLYWPVAPVAEAKAS
jgi:hypothetical protein